MVSSELVVLLIVCVGINTGSAQQGELLADKQNSQNFKYFNKYNSGHNVSKYWEGIRVTLFRSELYFLNEAQFKRAQSIMLASLIVDILFSCTLQNIVKMDHLLIHCL